MSIVLRCTSVAVVCLGCLAGWLVMGDDRERPPRERQQAADRLRETLSDEHAFGADFWVYNDIPQALEEARRLNRPLFVTFRCIPCRDCSAFDAEVAQGNDIIRSMAEEFFVPVRQVEMKGVDLTQFQFDHDLNWAAMFLHPDGTVLARYGTQSAEGADAYNSVEGLRQTMLRVLELHRHYPANRELFAGKRPEQKPYRTALEMPGLRERDRYRGETTRMNCIHCHNIHDAENEQALATGGMTDDLVFRYPYPENIGLTIDPEHGVRITEVRRDSPAARAGLRPGEDVVTMNGQAITSIADMQWVLHHLPAEGGELKVVGSRTGEHRLELPPDWKRYDISWRGSMWSMSPRLHIWAPELAEERRREFNLPAEATALEIRWINPGEASGRAVQAAGIQQGDVIVALNGEPITGTFPQFIAHIKLNYQVGDELRLTIQRGNRRREVVVPLVD